MNDWPCPELTWDDSYRPDRGKVYNARELSEMDTFARYLDVGGDGICYRTLPGEHPKGAYLIRGSGHNKLGGYTENADEYLEVVDRLRRKFDTAAELVPEPVIETSNKSSCALSHWVAVRERFKKHAVSWPLRGCKRTTCGYEHFRSASP
ncbi:MAG: hypothetical protein Ct9H300mP14_03060 [Gammaproteobacteria bacterium]|nr:MAG: hypothetical protein Ct9H300mP14_03060 [Gammaproteobacteria bacterium]